MQCKSLAIFLFLSAVWKTESLQCWSCSQATDVKECNKTMTCSDEQVCYKKREFTDQIRFELGCVDKHHCGGNASPPNATAGKMMNGGQTQYCYECCSTPNCNIDLCDHPYKCDDLESVDCAVLNSTISICDTTDQAKKICKKYCGLCRVNGVWSSWSTWSKCDVTCENGTQARTRSCTDPSPQHGGLNCAGDETELKPCQRYLCPVHGGWSDWPDWEKCSVTCGIGMQNRLRSCTNPAPDRFGDHCFGQSIEYKLCFQSQCKGPNSDCLDVKRQKIGQSSGIYTVQTWKTNTSVRVFCDMETTGGGWTVFQHRFDGSVDFYRNLADYTNGFGNLSGEFWLGLHYIQETVSQSQSELRIELTSGNWTTAYEVFPNFRLSASPYFTLNMGAGSGTAGGGTGLSYHNGQRFSTYDHGNTRCAKADLGGWWYGNCAYANLNGEYVTPGTVSNHNVGEAGMIYRAFDSTRSLKSTKMMFKRV